MACSHCGQNHNPTAHARYGCDALAESHDTLVEALEALVPEDWECEIGHAAPGYADGAAALIPGQQCRECAKLVQARAALDAARLSGTSESEG